MAGAVIESMYGKPLTFNGVEGPLVELNRWSFAEILSLSHIQGIPCQMGDLRFVELRNSAGDVATMVSTPLPGMVELVHTRKLKPWVKPSHPRVGASIIEAIAAYPGIFAFAVETDEVSDEQGQINISSLIELGRYPAPIAAEILRIRWEQALKVYRTKLAAVVTPFRPVAHK